MLERISLLILGLILGAFNFYTEKNFDVWLSMYFYQNNFSIFQNKTDWFIFLNTGLIGNVFEYLQLIFILPPIVSSLLVGVFSYLVGRNIYRYFTQLLPKEISLFLCVLIFLTPIQGEIREIVMNPMSINFQGLLFGLFPNPYVILFGFILLIANLNNQRTSRNNSIKKTGLFGLLLYSFHPFLTGLYLICIFLQSYVSRNRNSEIINKPHLKKYYITFGSIFVVFVSIFWMNVSQNFLGTFTFVASKNFDAFEVVIYIIMPFFFLVLALYLINISPYELLYKFLPIFCIYFVEVFFVVVSLLSGRNLMLFFGYNGIGAISHVLYYVPSVYVVLSVNRRQRIKWIQFAKIGDILEILILNLLPKTALLLAIVIVSITLTNNAKFLINDSKCIDSARILELYQGKYSNDRKPLHSKLFLVEVRKEILDAEKFSQFLELPKINPDYNSFKVQICEVNGLGFLILNGFIFNSKSIANSIEVLNEIKMIHND